MDLDDDSDEDEQLAMQALLQDKLALNAATENEQREESMTGSSKEHPSLLGDGQTAREEEEGEEYSDDVSDALDKTRTRHRLTTASGKIPLSFPAGLPTETHTTTTYTTTRWVDDGEGPWDDNEFE